MVKQLTVKKKNLIINSGLLIEDKGLYLNILSMVLYLNCIPPTPKYNKLYVCE